MLVATRTKRLRSSYELSIKNARNRIRLRLNRIPKHLWTEKLKDIKANSISTTKVSKTTTSSSTGPVFPSTSSSAALLKSTKLMHNPAKQNFPSITEVVQATRTGESDDKTKSPGITSGRPMPPIPTVSSQSKRSTRQARSETQAQTQRTTRSSRKK